MKRFSEQLYKKAETVKLRAAEKRALRERVVSYMEYHPLPANMKHKRVLEPALLTESYRVIHIPFTLVARYMSAALAIVLVIVPLMAERAVPGDALYAVKVGFNEEVRSTLVFGTYEKVEWETERLSRRISEARLLASEGRLTEEVEATVAEAVREHTENAQKGIAVLRSQDVDEATLATIALETTLEVQSVSLKEEYIDDHASSTAGKSTSFLTSVIDESRAKNNAVIASSTVPFEKIMARVELNTTRAYELLETVSKTATTEEIADITRRLQDIERSISEALQLEQVDPFTARALLIESLQRVQRLIVFMTDIDVSANVDIESIVPVVLTADEKHSLLQTWEADLNAALQTIDKSLEAETDAGVIAKAQDGLDSVQALKASMQETDDFVQLRTLYTDALALTADLLQLLRSPLPEVAVPEVVNASSTEAVPDIETASSTDTDRSSTTPAVE